MGNPLSFQERTVSFIIPTEKELKREHLIGRVTDQNCSMNRSNRKINKRNYFRTEKELLRDPATRCHSLFCGNLEILLRSFFLRGAKPRSTANKISYVKLGSGNGELLSMSFL